ncbi:MAG: EAL domain-containing protein, partial [Pseudomonadota bacterium]|nr:EAL domain-containing protein [Pseudomonadota bacterium]
CLEITESGAMEEAPAVLDNLNQLRQMGVLLAIDDYGTGYSSLSYVRKLPISELKIDQSFIKHMIDSPNDVMIVRSTIELAHSLGFRVVAEGVETQAISQTLADFGCDFAQGYFYARPLPFDDYVAWLQQQGTPSRA